MWHELGTVIPGGITDIDKVLELAGLDFEVVSTPVTYDHDGETRVMPGKWVTKRKDTGDPLGVIGKVYQSGGIVQNRAAFEFLEDLTGAYGVKWESAGALADFSKVFISMRLPESVVIDAEGINDEIIPFIVALNSFNAGSSFEVVVTPWRPVCGNTERFAVRDAHTRWSTRHSTNTTRRLAEARRTLGLSLTYFDNFAKEEEALAQANLEIDALREVIDGVWKPEPGETAAMTKKREHRSNHIVSLFEANAERLGRTAYAGERAFTEFLDHHVAVQPRGALKGMFAAARATRVLEGAQDEKKTTAHKLLLVRAGH
jgi:phage/plasmid-like protein (TIGR03299 family)